MADKKHKISKEDAALFRSQVKGATPLSSDRVVHDSVAQNKREHTKSAATTEEYAFSNHSNPASNQIVVDDNFDNNPIDANTRLFFSHPGLQHKETKRLKRGEMGIEARLDLHGMTTVQAKQKLLSFVTQCQQSEKRCVLVIHGRGLGADSGKAILKAAVNHWLPQIPAVMAFSSAQAKDGGLGAVYVLLRRDS